jgi:hypothetical protein
MVIDCDGCVMRDIACRDCVVTFLLGPADGLGSAEQTALAVLADGGLVPPLRMRPGASAATRPAAQTTTGASRPGGRLGRAGSAGRSAGGTATA